MVPLIVIRPEPGCAATVTAARELGLEAHGTPLFEVFPVAWTLPDEPVDALLVGSANAFRHGGPQLAALRDKPAYAVGSTTAFAATMAGFAVATVGAGGLQNVLDRIGPAHTALLRLCGQDRVALELPTGVRLAERVVYRSNPVPMPDILIQRLARPALVLLHSAEAARHFAAECAAHSIDRNRIVLAAIGPRVAAASGTGWAQVASAHQPDDSALLALAKNLCQTLDQ
ncbi:MAG TPA: uroporphyrinogen-III synthase [Novosphingobium sp.]|nr:uroporphyrinogen-III synthase [Novosphingobium sp.]